MSFASFIDKGSLDTALMQVLGDGMGGETYRNRIFMVRPAVRWTQEERFQLCTLFGFLALSRNTPSRVLRGFYRWMSHRVMAEAGRRDRGALGGGRLQSSEESVGRSTASEVKGRDPHPSGWRRVLITGWYGTETAGDKAILGEIVHALRAYNPGVEIWVSSIDVRVSWQTRAEMAMDTFTVPIAQMERLLEEREVDAVVFGGGPLMESSQIARIARVFESAARRGMQRVVFGCGVGPIHSEGVRDGVSAILRSSTVAFFRDQESLEYALTLGVDPERSRLACDPAVAYVSRWKRGVSEGLEANGGLVLATLLREQTAEYSEAGALGGLNRTMARRFADALTELSGEKFSGVESVAGGSAWSVRMHAMHMYWRGNDDRVFNARILEAMGDGGGRARAFASYRGLDELLRSLQASDAALAMRYHGHIFCIALNIPFVSIDYTGRKGKVGNLMGRIGYEGHSVGVEALASGGELGGRLGALLDDRESVRGQLADAEAALLESLRGAYDHFWGTPEGGWG